jgi:uncharacterized membrane protein/nitrite reductase/ring-hydroxylating ferredoxin subunit
MRRTAQIKSHPIHPILVAFPIAFFTGTLLFDVLAMLSDTPNLRDSFSVTAYYMGIAGMIGAVLAAVAGFIDYLYTVPPQSSAKGRATKHGLLNTTTLILFFIAWLLKRGEHNSYYLITGLELVGFVIMLFAGWLGGTLVYRNQIGVDPRYANAGKWKEERIHTSDKEIEVANNDELKLNQMKLLHINGKRIVLAKTENNYVAFDDHCTHRGGSLAGGSMICGTVQCPWHGSHFDVTTGAVKAGPAKENIATYPVNERGGKVYIVL